MRRVSDTHEIFKQASEQSRQISNMSASPAAGAVSTASVSHTMSMLTPEQMLSRNPHSALRLPGATYGSLSKSHNSLTVPPNLSWVHAHLVSAANPNRDEGAADSLAEAVGGNERSKAYEYCLLVGNVLRSYDSFAAFWRGDHPTVSRVAVCRRMHICVGPGYPFPIFYTNIFCKLLFLFVSCRARSELSVPVLGIHLPRPRREP